MKRKILMAISTLALTSGLQALTIDEQVAANTIDIGLNNASIESVANTLAAFEERINTLEAKVTTLEGFHDIREFTIFGTSGNDITFEGLKEQLSSLNYQSGEFLYIKTTSKFNRSEFCTSNHKSVDWLNTFASGIGGYTWWGYNQADTWANLETETIWSPVYRIVADAAPITSAAYFSLDAENTLSYSTSFLLHPHEINNDVSVNDLSDSFGDSSITFKVASTREAACGF